MQPQIKYPAVDAQQSKHGVRLFVADGLKVGWRSTLRT